VASQPAREQPIEGEREATRTHACSDDDVLGVGVGVGCAARVTAGAQPRAACRVGRRQGFLGRRGHGEPGPSDPEAAHVAAGEDTQIMSIVYTHIV